MTGFTVEDLASVFRTLQADGWGAVCERCRMNGHFEMNGEDRTGGLLRRHLPPEQEPVIATTAATFDSDALRDQFQP